MRILLLFISAISFLASCDCNQTVTGKIVDNETGQPLANVTVYNKNKSWSKTVTDTGGHFKLSNVSGGTSCPPMTIITEHKNYQKIEVSIDAGGYKDIGLERLKSSASNIYDLDPAYEISNKHP